MESVGIELKAAREKRNIPLGDVAAATRISHTNLERLEEGRYQDLPGGVYNRAFIRAYCEFLGLEAKEMLDRYEQEIAPISDKTPRAKEKTRIPSEPLIKFHPLTTWGVVLLVSIVGLYFSRHWIAGVFSPYFEHPPTANMVVMQPAAKPPANPVPPPSASSSAPATQAPLGAAPTQPVSGALSGTPSVAPQSAVPQPTAAKTAPAPRDGVMLPTPPARPGKIRLDIQVAEKCWISVNGDGNHVASKIMEPGEHYVFDADERFFLIVGNAGGIQLSINGKPAKSLGKSGEVARILINEQTIKGLLSSPSS